uniref:Uncharacterized protein n=1 Tax=Oryza glaberrima TaxID=4538 RepID=I1R1K2_ORYGL
MCNNIRYQNCLVFNRAIMATCKKRGTISLRITTMVGSCLNCQISLKHHRMFDYVASAQSTIECHLEFSLLSYDHLINLSPWVLPYEFCKIISITHVSIKIKC